MQRATVLVAVGLPERSQALRTLLELGYQVLGEVHDGQAVTASVDALHPDLVLLDLALPGRLGTDVLLDLLLLPCPPAVVALAARVDRALADYVLGRGTSVLLPADPGPAELYHALAAARNGAGFVAPGVAWAPEPDAARYPRGYQRLTLREQQVVQMIGLGLKNERIARHLHVSYRTVHFHRSNIRRKLDFHSDWEMARFALHVRDCAAGEDGSGSI